MLKRPPEYVEGNIEEISASDNVYLTMREYSRYIVASKYPHCVDGLKLGQRRALWVIKDHQTPVPENEFVGIVNRYHHHGDVAIGDTIKRMMRDTEYGFSLIGNDGHSGSYADKDGAAARYAEVYESPFTHDIFFDDSFHPKTIPMMAKEDYSGVEPMYLIPRIPTSLIFPQLTIGVGYKTVSTPLKFEHVCELVCRYSEYMQTIDRERSYLTRDEFDYSGLEYCFVPEFPSFCYLRNEKDLLESYKRKDFNVSFEVEGLLDVTPSAFSLRTLPYGKPMQTITDRKIGIINTAFKTKGHWLEKAGSQYIDRTSNSQIADFKVILKRGYHPMVHLDKFKRLVGLGGRYTPIMNFGTHDFILRQYNPIELIGTWYLERYNALLGGIKYRQIERIKEMSNLEAMLLISDHTDDVVNIIRTTPTKVEAEQQLRTKYDISMAQAKHLVDSPINLLNKEMKGRVLARLEDVKRLASAHTENIDKVHEIIYNDALALSKKYGRPRRTKLSKFAGYLNLRDVKGIIQFEDMEELVSLMTDFANESNMSVTTFQGDHTEKSLVVKGRIPKSTLAISKQTNGDGILEIHPEMTCTVKIADGLVSSVDQICTLEDMDDVATKAAIFYTTPRFLALNLYGHFKRMSIEDLSPRKSIQASGAKHDIICTIPLIKGWKEVFLVYSNSLHKNTVTIERVPLRKPNPLQLTPGGVTTILGIYPADMELPQVCLLPDHFSNMSGFLLLENLKETMHNETSKTVEFTNRSPKYKSLRQMYLLK